MTPADVAAWRVFLELAPDSDLTEAIRQWQSNHMLEPDGIPGPRTRAAANGLELSVRLADAGIIAGLHPSIHVYALRLLESCRSEEWIALCVTQGFRTMREQGDLFARGRTQPGRIVTNAPAGYSWHNFGLAFDVAVRADDGRATWPADLALWGRIGACGRDLGLEWGGDWRSPDRPHFQRTCGLTLAQARRGVRPAC